MSAYTTKSSGFNRYEPPSPSTQGDENLEETFLKDVEKFNDELPQPFRRIDKILSDIFEQAWICIVSNESTNQYGDDSDRHLDVIIYEEEFLISGQVNCVELVDDYAFVGTDSNLFAYKVPQFHRFLYNNEDVVEVDSITILSSNESVIVLLVQYKGKGNLSVFGFKHETFHFVADIIKNEDTTTNSDKISDIVFSKGGPYLAVSFQGNQTSLVVYKLPIDEWMSRLNELKSEEELANESKEEEEIEDGKEGNQPSIPVELSSSRTSQVSYSKASTIISLQPPTTKPCNNSMTVTLKEAEHGNAMIGDGSVHLLTSSFFENLQNEFRHLNGDCRENVSDLQIKTKAHCHFLKGQQSCSLFPSHNNNHGTGESYNSIGVWWENKNQFLTYSLSSKDTKQALISVLPHSDCIINSAVSEHTDIIAIALQNRCVTLWNRFTGQPIKTFANDHMITMMRLSSDGALNTRLTYATSNGKLWQSRLESDNLSNPVYLDSRCSSSTSCDQVSRCVDGPRNLVGIVWKSGLLIIYNEASIQPLCQLELFNGDLTKATNGYKIRLNINQKYILAVRDDGTEDKMQSRLFLFVPDQVPVLQTFFNNLIDDKNEEEKQSVDLMEKNLIKFLQKRKLSDLSLKNRISNYIRETLKQDRMVPVQS